MAKTWEWLLGLERIRLGRDAPLRLEWQLPFEPWVLFVVCAFLAAWLIFALRRESAVNGPLRRTMVALPRMLLAALVVATVCQPRLVLQRERVEPSWVALLIDTSHSMGRSERYPAGSQAQSVASGAGLPSADSAIDHNRLELARRAIARNENQSLHDLLRRNQVRLFAFSAGLESVVTAAALNELSDLSESLSLLKPAGDATDLFGSLDALLQRDDAARLSAIIVASDGQSTTATQPTDAIQRARALHVPIYPLRIGSPQHPRDVAVESVTCEENLFVKDFGVVRARLVSSGLDQQQPIEVQLIDEAAAEGQSPADPSRPPTTVPADGTVVETRSVELGGPQAGLDVEFRVRPDKVGSRSYRVRLASIPSEDNPDNNTAGVTVYVHDDKARVLYVEGAPRFEYRYLKNALLREATIRVSCLLLDADAEFAQEGDEPIARFPDDPEKLADYDVVIFGDVDPNGDWLSPQQAQMLVDFVSEKGGGFALIAGPSHAPHRFRGTVLEKLIPVRIDPDFLGRYDRPLVEAFSPELTPEGRNSRIFRFDADPQASADLFDNLPPLFWISRTLGPRAGADVLAKHPTMASTAGPMPLFVAGRYGAGKVLFCATDDTWRWRRHTGEFLHDTFWVQLVRSLMPLSASGVDRRLAIRTDRPRYSLAERVDVAVEVNDPQLLAMLTDSVRLTVEDPAGVVRDNLQADRLGPASNVFETSFIPKTPGRNLIHCRDILPGGGVRAASCDIVVDVPDAEARHPQADHTVLERLAAETGAKVVELDALPAAISQIGDRSVRIPDDYHEPLWDSKLVLILFTVLIALEWILRKIFGMM